MSLPSEKPQANWGTNQTLPALSKKVEGTSPSLLANGTMEENLDQSFSNGSSLYMGGMADHTSFQAGSVVEY